MTLPELQQAIVVAVMDVNAEKRAEKKSRQDAHELRCIIDAIPQAIVVYDPDGQPVYISRFGFMGDVHEDDLIFSPERDTAGEGFIFKEMIQ